MERLIAIFIGLLFLSAVFALMSVGIAYRLTPEHHRRRGRRWLFAWFMKGLFLPLLLWAVMNLGISWNLQPFIPEIQAAQNSGDPWFPEYLRYLGDGLFVICSFWAALTLAWTIVRAGTGLEKDARADFKALCMTCAIGMFIPAIGIIYLGGWYVLGLAALGILVPIAAYAPNIVQTKRLPPMYGRAVAKLKFGKYSEAELEIIHELERCEDDFEGWMMLADLYANQFNDLAEAEQTVLEICDQSRTTPSQVAVALHRLADWYVKLACDPDAARRALQIICDRLRGSHLAYMAQLRINQLPQSAQDLRDQQSALPIPMPALGDNLDEPVPEPGMTRARAREIANECVQKLTLDPNNVAAREKLARIFTESLGQPDLGIEQILLLLNMPDQTQEKRAEWLGMTAAWHIRYRHDPDTGRGVLERVIQEFPNSPQALVARRRIRLMGYSQA
jgi:hypothetical protein